MAKILITGGSGLVGKSISELLLNAGHEPRWLSREKGSWKGIPIFEWSISGKKIDLAAFEGIEHIIHLAGSGIVDKRWTASYKKQILDSRVKSSELLSETITKNKIALKTLIGASAIGYYGSSLSEQYYREDEGPGSDFLSQVCIAWENSYLPFTESGLRTVIIRTGIVLSDKGGAYAKMVPAFKMGLGAAIASGKQYFSWIHINDLSRIYLEALFNEKLHGIYNAVSSEPVTNSDFSKRLAKSLGKPFFMPNVPEWAINLALGECAVTVTAGAKVANEKIKTTGFKFQFDELDLALKDLKN